MAILRLAFLAFLAFETQSILRLALLLHTMNPECHARVQSGLLYAEWGL